MNIEPTPGKKTTTSRRKQGGSSAPQQQRQGDMPHPLIEIHTAPGRGGRQATEEKWPFGKLELATKDAEGNVTGPSLFIPESENPKAVIAAARKRYRGPKFIKFMTRGVAAPYPTKDSPLVKGVRVWKDPDQTPDAAPVKKKS